MGYCSHWRWQMSTGRIEVSRDVMIAFGQAAMAGNLKRLNSTDRKIIQTLMDGLINNQQSIILEDCTAMRLDKVMAKLASAPEEQKSSKLKQLSKGVATILGRQIPTEKLKLQSRAAVATGLFHKSPTEATFREMIERKKEYGTKRHAVKRPTDEALKKMDKIATLQERRMPQVRQTEQEVAYLEDKRNRMFEEFEDFQLIRNLWGSAASGKLEREGFESFHHHIISRMGLVADQAIAAAEPGLQAKLGKPNKQGDYNTMITMLEQADPFRAARLRALSKCKESYETYWLSRREIDLDKIESLGKEALSALKKKDKELKQLESKLQEERMRLDFFKAA